MKNNADLGFLDRLVFLAIDAGSEWAGVCVGTGREHRFSGRQNMKKYTRMHYGDPDNVWSRVEMFAHWTAVLICSYRPDFLIMELPTGDHDNRHTDRVMGALLGALIIEATRGGARRVQCTPQEVKATGYHKGAKRDAALFVGVPLEQMKSDQADALGLWQAGLIKVRDVMLSGTPDFAAIDVVNGDTLYVVDKREET
jgi:Holliday junction resolvasome RuvABC endonuclease subunit